MDKNSIEYIKQQSEKFNLEDFYLYDGMNKEDVENEVLDLQPIDGAMIVITPFQTISLPAPEEHFYVTERIYRVLYDSFDRFTFPEYLDENTEYQIWQEQALEYGNVLIQVCLGSYSPVWIPKHINDYQYSELEKVVSFIKENYLTERSFYYRTNIEDKNLEDVMEELKDRMIEIPYNNQERLLWGEKEKTGIHI